MFSYLNFKLRTFWRPCYQVEVRSFAPSILRYCCGGMPHSAVRGVCGRNLVRHRLRWFAKCEQQVEFNSVSNHLGLQGVLPEPDYEYWICYAALD